MPARRRHRQPKTGSRGPQDPVTQFGMLLAASAERDKAERRRVQEERTEANRLRREAEAHAAAVETQRQVVADAVAAARQARKAGVGVVEADACWAAAKAELIRLETGAEPQWSPAPRF